MNGFRMFNYDMEEWRKWSEEIGWAKQCLPNQLNRENTFLRNKGIW